MTTVVTGGSGFIGQHLVRLLAARGEKVRVLDLQPPQRAMPHGVEFVQGSVLEQADLARSLQGAESVFHLAANAHLWAKNRKIFEQINHQGTQNLIDAARSAGVRRFVHTSSLTVLIGRSMGGDPQLVNEDIALKEGDMLGPYPRSKWRAEKAALSASTDDFQVTAVLPTLPMGPGDDGLTAPTRMVLDLINGKIPAYLECIHNVIHVEDAALGHILARDKGTPGARYILGGDNLTMSDLIKRLGRLTGARMPKSRVPYPVALAAGHVQEFVANRVTKSPPQAPLTGVRLAGQIVRFDTTRARNALCLHPRGVDEALSDAIRWLKAQGLVTRPLPAFQ